MRNECIRAIAATALCLALGACEQLPAEPQKVGAHPRAPGDQPLLQTDAQSYERGALVRMRLVNRTKRPVLYNLCRSSLERAADGGWQPVSQTLADVCTADLRPLPPGHAADYAFKLDAAQRRGEYRIRTRLYDAHSSAYVEALSNPFQLRRDD